MAVIDAKEPKWPFGSREGLRAAGYTYEETAACKGPRCGATIEWWRTPAGRLMPIDPTTFEAHWATCPDSRHFKKKR